MIVVGLLLIVLAVLLGLLGFWLSTSNQTFLELVAGPFGLNLAPVTLFIWGMVVVAVLWVGWWLVRSGTKRTVRNRRERKQWEADRVDQQRQAAVDQARPVGENRNLPQPPGRE